MESKAFYEKELLKSKQNDKKKRQNFLGVVQADKVKWKLLLKLMENQEVIKLKTRQSVAGEA